ncbi:MAG: DUF2723 domain-containing protein [Caldilineaceae bacterium]|nr:DUF2723 domain-containing protein [Caldilineaceae bacterium]
MKHLFGSPPVAVDSAEGPADRERGSEALPTMRWESAGATLAALLLYIVTLAPSITWAHDGADSGELLAAAVTNGVPHPPGYPLYMILLQGWLWLTGLIFPAADLAWRGNLFSALCAALSVGVTVVVLGRLLAGYRWSKAWALLGGLAWAVSLLLWTQAVVTEVYALHSLLLALLGWAVLCPDGRSRLSRNPAGSPHSAPAEGRVAGFRSRYSRRAALVLILAFGFAHHLTFLLLLPAALYYLWTDPSAIPAPRARFTYLAGILAAAGVLAALFYVRTPLVAGTTPPPPVNWGYPDNLAGFWWLVSGSAYRGYFFTLEAKEMLGRVASWAYTVTTQYTPAGLGLALLGFAYLDGSNPRLRNFSVFWLLPVSLYSISYYTRDSEIYLLPVVWLMAVWMGFGLAVLADWLGRRPWHAPWRAIVATGAVIGLTALLLFHLPSVSLRGDREATDFLAAVEERIEPGSIIITTGDTTTFAVWYGAWGDGSLLAVAPDAVIVNYSLYQFDWYQRLLDNLYPNVANVGTSAQALIEANIAARSIYLTEKIPIIPDERLQSEGPLWRIK